MSAYQPPPTEDSPERRYSVSSLVMPNHSIVAFTQDSPVELRTSLALEVLRAYAMHTEEAAA